jgi:hypothetical protein
LAIYHFVISHIQIILSLQNSASSCISQDLNAAAQAAHCSFLPSSLPCLLQTTKMWLALIAAYENSFNGRMQQQLLMLLHP